MAGSIRGLGSIASRQAWGDPAGDDHKALRKIAAALLAKAANGDVPAINSLTDRTDGKVAQALIGDGWTRYYRPPVNEGKGANSKFGLARKR